MGFQYELAKQFAESLGLKLKIKTASDTEELVHMLLNGEGDFIAYPLPITKEFKDSVLFCGEDIITHQVLVQRNSQKGQKALANVTDLIDKDRLRRTPFWPSSDTSYHPDTIPSRPCFEDAPASDILLQNVHTL